MVWKNEIVSISIIEKQVHFIHMRINKPSHSPWLLTTTYINSNVITKNEAHEELCKLASVVNQPWLIVGNFNNIKGVDEKNGTTLVSFSQCSIFL